MSSSSDDEGVCVISGHHQPKMSASVNMPNVNPKIRTSHPKRRDSALVQQAEISRQKMLTLEAFLKKEDPPKEGMGEDDDYVDILKASTKIKSEQELILTIANPLVADG
jgi:hypothetical protein